MAPLEQFCSLHAPASRVWISYTIISGAKEQFPPLWLSIGMHIIYLFIYLSICLFIYFIFQQCIVSLGIWASLYKARYHQKASRYIYAKLSRDKLCKKGSSTGFTLQIESEENNGNIQVPSNSHLEGPSKVTDKKFQIKAITYYLSSEYNLLHCLRNESITSLEFLLLHLP